MRLTWGSVTDVIGQRTGLQTLDTDCGRAYCYPELTGACAAGDRVLLNTTAVDLGLGTGGVHFVVARVPVTPELTGDTYVDANNPDDGHIMKLRYSPLQRNVLAVESQESPWHAVMETHDGLDGVPVVCCGLHSQVALVAAAAKKAQPTLRIGYVMDDAAALALPLSDLMADAVDVGLIDVTVSTGQAFGGQLEAINLHSGLLAAVHVGGCDLVITGIGPGLAGTGTPFGHGGVAQGEAINATAVLGGVPVMCLRASQADARERHQGISHHSLEVLSRIALAPAMVAIPFVTDADWRARVAEQLDAMENPVGHEAMELEAAFYDKEALRGLTVTTMRRGYEDDPLFFEAAFAAGAVGAAIAVRTDGDGVGDALPPCATRFDISDMIKEQ
ncbi:MAG: DUF3866 family protein [Actinomycetes bacterium]|jgi:hypothetical protein|nr:DUF3866 family protein [Actinomycetes bacterium]